MRPARGSQKKRWRAGRFGALQDEGTDTKPAKCMIVSAFGALVVCGPPQGRPFGLGRGEAGD